MPHATYLAEAMGRATITPTGAFEAGSFASFELVYTAGRFGIDDTGALKIVQRFASDAGEPQFADPRAPNYVSVEASNGAVLAVRHDPKDNIRPWDKTIYIKVVRGFLREGDRITVRLGDRRGGSPGLRLQTFREEAMQFRVLVDVFATYDFVELPEQPTIAIVPGPTASWRLVLPSLRRAGEPFALGIRREDRWGNPTGRGAAKLELASTYPLDGLPRAIVFAEGEEARRIDGLSCECAGDVVVHLVDEAGHLLAESNPLRVDPAAGVVHWWGDLHGQSGETIGTGTIEEYFTFARDRAFLDICAHQGNDFQITQAFWAHLNRVTREFHAPGRFVTFPGYEWSGNTGMGGDRNVFFREEGRPIRRSSHALVPDLSDADMDAFTVEALFERLRDEDCVVWAHVGGRYADIVRAHDPALERAVEVHSAWGTFEWLLDDAFAQGYRVGVVANSDGHKGRPGASHPGAAKFGAYGGLTCFLAPTLDRDAIFEAMRARRHYATTGCRAFLALGVHFEEEALRFDGDPALGASATRPVRHARMGEILRTRQGHVELRGEVLAASPVERVELRNGTATVACIRPFAAEPVGARLRVIWEGAEYRGRGRETVWDGFVELDGNRFVQARPINRFNPDRRFALCGDRRVEWEAPTTGNFAGVELILADAAAGALRIATPHVETEFALDAIGVEDRVFEAGGLGRRLRVFRLPDSNPHRRFVFTHRVALRRDGDNALYVAVTLEDGHRLWSSPIYLVP